MPTPSPTTAEILLDVLEFTSLGAATSRQLTAEIRKRHGWSSSLNRQLRHGLEMLEAERLVEPGSHLGRRVYKATPAGLATLEERGRYPHGAAVLFTDLVGSTALIGTFGEDEAHALRLRHFGLLRAAVVKHGGREVKGLGDGLMVVFSAAAAAIACGVDMQRSVSTDADGLGLRVGVHVGPLLREHDDFHGTTVIVAARLCDRAEAGQILVSSDVLEADEHSVSDRASFLGDLALKGLDQPVPTYEVTWS